MNMSTISIQPLPVPEGSGIDFGATVSNVDLENLTGKIVTMYLVIQ